MVKKGVPFRDAYKEIAGKIGKVRFKPTSAAEYTHTGSIGNPGTALVLSRAESIEKSITGPSPSEIYRKIAG